MKAQLSILDSMVFSKLKNHMTKELRDKYDLNNDNFSTIKSEPTGADFPFVSVMLISATETSTDLERTTLNGGLYTYQIKVFDNVSQARAKEVMDSAIKAMKSMMFNSTSLPINVSDDSKHIMIARFQRFIDEGDSI